MNIGKVKQKAADMRWWIKGVHQIVLWVGTARGGKASRGKGKGKGKGKGHGEGEAKGKRR